jgi:hypothetical protein
VVVLLAVANGVGDAARRADPGPAGVGDPVRDGQFQFVVRSVDCGARSVGQGFGRRQALGQFCLVALQVENTGTEGRTFGGGQQYLFDRAGKRHDPDLGTTAGNGGGRLVSTHLNPGQRHARLRPLATTATARPTATRSSAAPSSGPGRPVRSAAKARALVPA